MLRMIGASRGEREAMVSPRSWRGFALPGPAAPLTLRRLRSGESRWRSGRFARCGVACVEGCQIFGDNVCAIYRADIDAQGSVAALVALAKALTLVGSQVAA